ncbi:MAG: mechanosensitive ion channel [Anaerolineae bacterium]|nr:mechanosensitive ion channel [Anaerolineae bacterium]
MFDLTPAIDKVRSMILSIIEQLPNLIVAIIVFAVFFIAASLLKRLVQRISEQTNMPPTASLVLGRLTRAVIILIGALVSLPIIYPNFTAAQVIETLGIGGVAIGFAFRDILQNFLAGILLFITQPFKIGDQIVVRDYEGTVQDIQTRATLIKMYDGRLVVIPNSDLFTQSVTVNTAFPIRRSQYDFGIGCNDDISLAKQLIIKTIEEVDFTLKEPKPEAFVWELTSSSINIRARWWTSSVRSNVVNMQAHIIEAVIQALTEAGIDLPYTTYQVLFHDQTEETDGDRALQREGWPSRPGGDNPRPARIAAVSDDRN